LAGPRLANLSVNTLDPEGGAVASVRLTLVSAAGVAVRDAISDQNGHARWIDLDPGQYQVTAEISSFAPVTVSVSLSEGQQASLNLQFVQIASVRQAVTVVGASAPSALTPDPSERVVIHDQVLDANPGRPGAPISIPGDPIETASGGIKAPQYFAPGVAGDHGEPIAQFYQIGDFLYPNNLPANAHGNGYADPNFLIAPMIEAVGIDGGAFNVREGNNSVDLAATYVPRVRLNSFVELTGDYRDIDLVAGWSPKNPATNAFVAVEAAYGNGYLARLEHRQQYKVNAFRQFNMGRNVLTLFGVGYYGVSDIPGLIPINMPVVEDTVDGRQFDRTNTAIFVASDTWRISDQQQLTLSGFFREYALTLRSNFGPQYSEDPPFSVVGGLIQQSETRTIFGGGPLYTQQIEPWLSILAGVDLRRDAPRDLDLKVANAEGEFQPVTSNNLTLSFVEPYASLDGTLSKYLHYDVGLRREEVRLDNEDNIDPAHSSNNLEGLTLPKATLTVMPPQKLFLPIISFSYGEAFHTEDPRIGTGTTAPTLLATSRLYQLVLAKSVKQFDFKATLKHVTNSQELAKIDPDTGLQEDEGPSRNRVLVLSLQRSFSQGSVSISYAQADARDLQTGAPTPEAPRFIWDTVATANRLPFGLHGRCEFEYVRAKPLGDGFVGVAVPEFRGALIRPFLEGRMSLGTEFLIASGYTGQTTEVFAYPTDPTFPIPIERVVGVPLKSYITVSWTYHFTR